MKNIILILLFALPALHAYSQVSPEKDTVLQLETAVYIINRLPSKLKDSPQQVRVIDRTEINRLNAGTAADLLERTGEIFVQRSQAGGGSPVLRGLESSRVLLLMDGMRMNNLIYRSGHLQNVITIDGGALENVEILYGSGSTVFGSDALGGAMNFQTKKAVFSEDGFKTSGSAFMKVASASFEKTANLNLNLGFKKWAMLTSATYTDFGDTRMGANRGADYPEFGKRNFFVQRINGRDSIVPNSDPNIQKFTGYNQMNFMQKIAFKPNANTLHRLAGYFTTSSDITRYDRLTDVSPTTGLASAEWYYGPQLFGAANYQFDFNSPKVGFIKLLAFYQKVDESRHTRSFNSSNRTSRVESVDIVGLNLDWGKMLGNHQLTVGIDGQYNWLKSTAFRANVNNGNISAASTRYPDGANSMYNASLYLTHTWRIGQKLTINDGLRVGYIGLKSEFVDQTFFPFPYSQVVQNHFPVTGQLGLTYRPIPMLKIGLAASSGYRAPNVDDLGKVFDSVTGNVIVPSPSLGPERTASGELNLEFDNGDGFRLNVNGYYTELFDVITLANGKFNGQDSIMYGGIFSQVQTMENKDRAYVMGANFGVNYSISNFTFFSSATYTYGRIRTEQGAAPLDHIPPFFGKGGLRFSKGKWEAEAFCLFNLEKPLNEYRLNAEDNERYATPDGSPAWATLNLRLRYQIRPFLGVHFGCDNLIDTHYRQFSSGVSAPGRNFYLTLRSVF